MAEFWTKLRGDSKIQYMVPKATLNMIFIVTCYLNLHNVTSFYYNVTSDQVKLPIFYNVQTNNLNI